jgi:LacI family transcriptional regulator
VPFTAVFGANGPTTLGAVRALRERLGHEAASEIEVVSFDDLDWFEFASPPISAARNDAAMIGRLGVLGLIDLIEGRETTSQRVPADFIDRSPTGA